MSSENRPLLYQGGVTSLPNKWKSQRCCAKYRLPFLNTKPVVILIVWNVFIMLTANVLQAWSYTAADDADSVFYYHKLVRQITEYLLVLAYPLLGWLADAWTGRFRIISASLYFLFLAIFFVGAAIICNDYQVKTLTYVFAYLAMATRITSNACYSANYIQFTTDHLVGASADQLSFTVYWLLWADFLAQLVEKVVVSCPQMLLDSEKVLLISYPLSVLFLCASILWICVWKGSLLTRPLITNPIKDICRVLCYARRHKYPERRSALTYWENEYPSRLDLGKDKYGGPFTEDAVESVKTVLRLIPLIMCISVLAVSDRGSPIGDVLSGQPPKSVKCVVHQVLFTDLLPVIAIPVYHFLIYPFCYNYIPTMLRRFGIGFAMIASSIVISFVLFTIGNVQNKEAKCMGLLPLSYWWSVVPTAFSSIGFMLAHFSSYEFVVAQSPHHMKGLTIGLLFGFRQLFKEVANDISHLFPQISTTFLNCGFYYYLTYMLTLIAGFFLFLLVSKWYKLRVRNTPVPYHLFAEAYAEKGIKEEEYREVHGNGCTTQSMDDKAIAIISDDVAIHPPN